ncbi:hypothetical protein SALINJAH_212 [Bacillus phage SalinJah]|uniref:Uncharacterized protein n=1 Tax=Bacillus phage SalinJah TaxID=1837830 RepID=A0A173GCK1_9CAUD|nr:virion structural protein [Bacillus phage SalinJah]ANH50769.1 hypothetical protein SALINJAH_212 [Bacillus phage SalinJah]
MAVSYDDIAVGGKWEILNFDLIQTLEDKLDALLHGDVLVIRKFEKFTKADVMIKMQTVKGHQVTMISYDTMKSSLDNAFWQVYNISINDLSMLPVMQVYDVTHLQEINKFQMGDVVSYKSAEDGKVDTAYITDVYRSLDPNKKNHYLYSLSREAKFAYEENELMEAE